MIKQLCRKKRKPLSRNGSPTQAVQTIQYFDEVANDLNKLLQIDKMDFALRPGQSVMMGK